MRVPVWLRVAIARIVAFWIGIYLLGGHGDSPLQIVGYAMTLLGVAVAVVVTIGTFLWALLLRRIRALR